MGSNRHPTELHRLEYAQGQMLRSRDLREQLSIEAQLRWWHNRAIHSAYGIASGLRVVLESSSEDVTIYPGLAYDSFGRELLLSHCRTTPIPALTQDMALLVRYQDADHARRSDQIDGACLSTTHDAHEDSLEFFWKPTDSIRIRDGVTLARLARKSVAQLEALPAGVVIPDRLTTRIHYDQDGKQLVCQGVLSDSDKDTMLQLATDQAYQKAVRTLFERSHDLTGDLIELDLAPAICRGFVRPHMESGGTLPGGTPWEIWNYTGGARPIPVGLEVRIDTSQAGFTQVPCYFAWLQWPPLDLTDPAMWEIFRLWPWYVEDPTMNGFVFRLLIATELASEAALLPIQSPIYVAREAFRGGDGAVTVREALSFVRAQQLSICWLGIQAGREWTPDRV